MSSGASPVRQLNVPGDVPPQILLDIPHAREMGNAWTGLHRFYSKWLADLCQAIGGVSSGVLLMWTDGGGYRPSAVWPEDVSEIGRLRVAIERAVTDRTTVVARDTGEAAPQATAMGRLLIAHPIASGGKPIGVVAIEKPAAQEGDWQAALQLIRQALASPMPQVVGQQAPPKVAATATDLAIDALAAFSEADGFDAPAVMLANTLADRLGCQRVSIGLAKPRGVALKAMSHSAAFDRKSDLAVTLQGVMEEAFDQRGSVSFPALPSTERRIAVAHADFAARWRAAAVLSVLIKSAGRRVGVLTLEWDKVTRIDAQTLQTCEFVADQIGPLVDLKHRQQQLISGRVARWASEATAKLFGPGRPSLKLGAAAAVLLLALAIAWPADFRIAAKVVLEGSVQRAAVVPFDGFVAEAPLRAGDIVQAGQVLARLDDRDLKLEKLKWETERQKLVQRQREAFAKHDRPNILITSAQIEQAESQLKLALEKLQRAEIASPIDGVIVNGDLSQMLGAPVTQGKVLFEIAPLNSYRLLLQVDERDIGYVRVGQTGTLLLTGAPASGLQLAVTKLTSVATAEDARNFFRVEGSLADSGRPLRPGMEGLAKIDVGRRSLIWIWTRPLLERLRMLVWAWTP